MSPPPPVPGRTLPPDAEVVDRLRSGQSVAVHVVHLHAVEPDARDEGLGDAWRQ